MSPGRGLCARHTSGGQGLPVLTCLLPGEAVTFAKETWEGSLTAVIVWPDRSHGEMRRRKPQQAVEFSASVFPEDQMGPRHAGSDGDPPLSSLCYTPCSECQGPLGLASGEPQASFRVGTPPFLPASFPASASPYLGFLEGEQGRGVAGPGLHECKIPNPSTVLYDDLLKYFQTTVYIFIKVKQ